MKRRTFLWLSAFLAPAMNALSFGKKSSTTIECTQTSMMLRWFVTDNILLKCQEGWETNMHADWVKICGDALLAKGAVFPGTNAGPDAFVGRLKFESELIEKDRLSVEVILHFVNSVRKWIDQRHHLFDPIEGLPPKLEFTLDGKPVAKPC